MASSNVLCISLFLFCAIDDVAMEAVLAKGFDAFLLRPITANVTCGSPPEEYYNTKEGYVSPRLRKLSVCNASHPAYSRPPKHMVDGNSNTTWQSRNDVDKAFITIALEQPMYGKQLLFVFGDYRRPGQIAIYKSTNYGKTYQPWHFLVSHRTECTTVFGIPPNEIFVLPDSKINRVLCREYSGLSFEYGERVLVELNGEIRGDGSNFYESEELLSWMNVTNVHIRFSGLYRKYDYIDTRWHHYVVKQVTLIARCDCNGHGDGVSCPMNKFSTRECKCNDHTCGPQCGKCCPAYNQYPWKRGSRSSWISDNSTQCEKCNCHGHSEECRYNEDIADGKLSLDIYGKYAGGGECLNCKDNTEGINCEKCKKFHYQPPNIIRSSPGACPPCACSSAGSTGSIQNVKYLECVRDSAMAVKFPKKKVGECFCKRNVIGAKCDRCVKEFYRLETSNKEGCRPCKCFLDGTVQRLNLCHKDFFGQCLCKKNVKLRDCSMCKDGYYGLNDVDVEGCKWCKCDVGASINQYVCNKYNGECTCRPHIYGRQCKKIREGYFIPDMHYIQGGRYLYSPAKPTLKTILEIPKDSKYKLLVGYIMTYADEVELSLYMKRVGSNKDIFSEAQPTIVVFQCNIECFESFQIKENDAFVLKSGQYDIEIRTSVNTEKLNVERIVAIPYEYTTAEIITEKRRDFLRKCSVEVNFIDLRGTNSEDEILCRNTTFSMTLKFEGGGIACGCNALGSHNLTCDPFGGQCACKPGVGGRDCSHCLPTFYKFSPNGCTGCGCKGPDKVCNPTSGDCKCLPNSRGRICHPCFCNNNSAQCLRNGTCLNCSSNTMGNTCEHCKPAYYGNALSGDCNACNCDHLGSYNKSCDMRTGQCYCRPGVVGIHCSQCAPNYYGLSASGCTACNCGAFGSVTLQCSQTGKCLCLPSTKGYKCDGCKHGYFGLPRKPCEACNCNLTGTFLDTFCGNDAVGQCSCKKGIQSRACDQCQKQHFEFGGDGCTQCPLCTRKLQSHADKVEVALHKVKSNLRLINNLTALQTELLITERFLMDAQLNAVYFDQRLLKGQNDYTILHEQKLKLWNSSVSSLMKQMSMVTNKAAHMSHLVNSSTKKITCYYNEMVAAERVTNEADFEATSTFTQIVKLNKDASKILKKAYSYIQDTPSFNFNQYVTRVDTDLATSNKVLANVSDVGKMVDYQERFSEALSNRLSGSKAYFQQKQKDWSSGAGIFMTNIHKIYLKGKDVETLLNQTKAVIDKQRSFIVSTKQQHLATQSVLVQMDALYRETQGIYEKTRMHTQMISGGIEVLFLQYNPQNSIVRVNVVRGYSLVPRDYVTMKSDPYFRLSISPKWFSQKSQESEPKYGTLNPTWDWPIGGTYSFLITSEQMKVTKLNISIYDYDVDSVHDFMGEVIIDMAKILPRIKQSATQRVYPLRPQGSASLGASFPGVGDNGLLDLQQMLKSQIVAVEQLLIETNRVYSAARVKAGNLQVQAQLLTSTFDQAKRYASTAVNAVNTYNEIYRLINLSLAAAIAANTSVQDITQILKGISVSTFKTKTKEELIAAQRFIEQARARNVSYAVIRVQLRSHTTGSRRRRTSVQQRSMIKVNGIEYKPIPNGHTVALIDHYSGKMEQMKNFRTDIHSQTASLSYEKFLRNIPPDKIIVIVKQGSGSIHSLYQADVAKHLRSFGGAAPFFSNHRGTYIFLGIRKQPGDVIPWISRVMKAGVGTPSWLSKKIQLKGTLQDLLTTANATFHAALPQWTEINQLFPQVKQGIQRLQQESFTASVLEASLQGANIMISQAVTSAQQVLLETQKLLQNVNELTTKYNYLIAAPTNISDVIDKGHNLVKKAEGKLMHQVNSLQQADVIEKSFPSTNAKITANHLSIDEKLAKLKVITARLPFTILYNKYAYSVFKVKYDESSPQKMFTVIQFDFKPRELNGILFYLLTNPPSLVGSIGVYMKDGYPLLAYNMVHGDIVGRLQIVLQADKWYTAHISRVGRDVYFLIQDATGYKTIKKLTSPHSHDIESITLNAKTRWYLNGFPSGMMLQQSEKYGHFSGTYDNLFMDGVRYNLWDDLDFDGVRSYANYRFPLPKKANGSSVSLFGNGYVKHKVGLFSISNRYSAVELEFRTLKDNVVMFGVTGSSGSFVYGLFISAGKLMFQFATSLGNNIALITTRNNYNNGQWYKVKVSRNGVNASLSVTPMSLLTQHLAESKEIFIGVTNLPAGVVFIIGAASSYSSAPPPVRGTFAGELKNLYLSDREGNVVYRSFTSPAFLIEQKGTSYYGMITGQIVPGVRFYGYMWWAKTGSYALLKTFKDVNVKSIYMSFKTSQLSGMLIYKIGRGTQSHLYLGMIAGSLVIIQKNNHQAVSKPYITQDICLADGQWHNMSLAYTYGGFQLRVDNKLLYTGWFGSNINAMVGKGEIYVGGIHEKLITDFQVPTTRSLEIDFDSFLINRIQQNLVSSSVGVSVGGIKPGLDMARPAPSCAAAFPGLLFSPDPVQVRFGRAPWAGYQSYLGYNLPQKVLGEYFVSSFVITMSFRAAVGDGMVFYIANNATHPTQYVSLELVNGKLRYDFFNGENGVTIETGNTTQYYGKGQWYKVYLLRIYQFGAMLVPETMEYKNNRHNKAAVALKLTTPLYIGGLPDHVNAPNLINRKYGYNGCLRTFEISAGYETYAIDFKKPDLGGTPTGTTACYSNSEPGVYFSGKDSWVYYKNNFVLPTDFSIELRFRTYRRWGSLLYLFSRQTPRGVAPPGGPYGSYMLLELNDGKLQLHYKASLIQYGKIFEWKDTRTDTSYYLCNQKWHVVKVTKVGQSITISVDASLAFGGGSVDKTNSGLINGQLWIGGVKGDIQKPGVQKKKFEGCLELLSLGKSTSSIQGSIDGNNVIFGCPTF